jgi:hypothetical protein
MATYTRWFSISTASTKPDDLLAIEWGRDHGKDLLKGAGEKVGRDLWPARRDKLREVTRKMAPEAIFALLPYAMPSWVFEDKLLKRLNIKPLGHKVSGAKDKNKRAAAEALLKVPPSEWIDHLRLEPPARHHLEGWLLHVLLHEAAPTLVPSPGTTRLSLHVKVTYQFDQMPTASPPSGHRDLALRLLSFYDSRSALTTALGGEPTGDIPHDLPFLFVTKLEGRTRMEGTIHVLADDAVAAGYDAGQGDDSTAW